MTPAQQARWEFEKGVADALMELTDKQLGNPERSTSRVCQWCNGVRGWIAGVRFCPQCDCPGGEPT